MKRPSFQWYPGDFRRDTGVQACCFEARSLWREMMDLMHDGEPYGHLTAGGVAIKPENLARLVGMPVAKVTRWLRELEDHKVFSKTEAGVIYSRRMVKDELHRERRGAGGAKSLDNPNVPRPKDRPKVRREDTAKDTRKDTLPPSSGTSSGGSPAVAVASAVAVTTKPKATEQTSPFPKSVCDPLYEAWISKRGAIEYSAFRKALAPLFPASGPRFAQDALAGAIDAHAEYASILSPKDARFENVYSFAANIDRWIKLGSMPAQLGDGTLTERGRLIMEGVL